MYIEYIVRTSGGITSLCPQRMQNCSVVSSSTFSLRIATIYIDKLVIKDRLKDRSISTTTCRWAHSGHSITITLPKHTWPVSQEFNLHVQ